MSRFASELLTWYRDNARSLPWRGHPDPYAVWVSEIMLQQTRVETVPPFFERWMKRFPTVKVLAKASEQTVLKEWEGLGYYSRARNLLGAARIVVERFEGELPREVGILRQLPGIGRYTAGAIASIAFGLDEPALDANVRRVLARVFDVGVQADSASGEQRFWELAARHLPKGKAGDYNQALMDLGARICRPKSPLCPGCPVANLCRARKAGTIEDRPRLRVRKRIPHYIEAAAVIERKGRVLLCRRPEAGLLGGMWEFPAARVEGEARMQLAGAILAATGLKVRRRQPLEIVQHAYSHFRVTVHPFHCQLVSISSGRGFKWVKADELENYPMGRIDRQIARQLSR